MELNRFQPKYRGSKFSSELILFLFPFEPWVTLKSQKTFYILMQPLRGWKFRLNKLSLGFTFHFRDFNKCNKKLQRFVQYNFESNLGKLKKHLKWSLVKVVITVFPVTLVNHVDHVTYAKIVTQWLHVGHVYQVLLISYVLFVAPVTLACFVIHVTYANHVICVTFVDPVYLMNQRYPADMKSEKKFRTASE